MIRRHLMALRLVLAVDGASATTVFLLVSLARFGDGEWLEIWSRSGSTSGWHPSSSGSLGRRPVVAGPLSAARSVAPADGGAWTSFGRRSGRRRDPVGAVVLQAGERQPALPPRPVGPVQPLVTPASRTSRPRRVRCLPPRGLTALHAGGGDGPAGPGVRGPGRAAGRPGVRVIGDLSSPASGPTVSAADARAPGRDRDQIFHDRVVDEVAVCLDPPSRPLA